jgi:hypothetical protein
MENLETYWKIQMNIQNLTQAPRHREKRRIWNLGSNLD